MTTVRARVVILRKILKVSYTQWQENGIQQAGALMPYFLSVFKNILRDVTKQNSFSFFTNTEGHLICSYCRKGTKIMKSKTNFTRGCGQTSGIPLDSAITSGKKPRPFFYLSSYIRISMAFKFQIYLWTATLIASGLSSSQEFIPPRNTRAHWCNLMHFHGLPHLKIQQIGYQEIFVGQT